MAVYMVSLEIRLLGAPCGSTRDLIDAPAHC